MEVKKILPEWMQEEMQELPAKELSDAVKRKQEEWIPQEKKKLAEEPIEEEEKEAENSTWEPEFDVIDEEDKALYDALRKWRMTKAREKMVVPYRIITNRTIRSIIIQKPRDMDELEDVKGLGPQKIKEFGEELLTLVTQQASPPLPAEKENETTEAILSAVRETDEKYGAGRIAEFLAGGKSKYIETMELYKLASYGRLKHLAQTAIEDKIDDLVRKKILYRTFGLYPTLKIKDAEQKRL